MKHLKTFEGFDTTPQELEEYTDSSAKIDAIISCVAESGDQELADQLKFCAEGADDWDDFAACAIEEIQDLKGVDHEAATRLFLDFEMQCEVAAPTSDPEPMMEKPALGPGILAECPNCGANEPIEIGEGNLECAECGNTYRVDEKKTA